MRATLSVIWLLLGLAAAAAQGCGNQNPNCIVSTRPTGDNGNAAASTAFVQSALPAINATAAPYYADSSGTNEASGAIQSAINALPTSGGTVLLAPGNYKVNSASIRIGNGNGTNTASTVNGIRLACTAATRPGVNGISGTPSTGPCNIVSGLSDYAIKVLGPINGWGIEGISITFSTTNVNAGGITVNSASFGDVNNFMANGVPGICILEFVESGGGQASFFNTWRNIQCRLLSTSSGAQGIHIGSNQASVDNFGDTWDNINIIPLNAGHTSLYIGSADSMAFNRLTINPLASSQALSLVYNEASGSNTQWPSGITFVNVDFGTSNNVSNTGTPGIGARPNLAILNTVNNGTIYNLANLAVYAPGNIVLSPNANNTNGQIATDANGNIGFKGTAPTLTGGCNGAGSSVTGNNNSGLVVGQTAPATTCTLTFANSGFTATPTCVFMPLSQAAFTTAPSYTATTATMTFPATANYTWTYHCDSIN